MSTSTVIVTPSVLLREGIASLLQNTRYKVVASAVRPAELSSGCCPTGQQTLAIVGIDLQNGNLDEVAESIRLLRSLLPDGKVVLVAETNGGIDPQRVLALSSDACIFNLDSRDALIRVLELTFLDQLTFVFAKSTSKEDESTDPARDLQSKDPYRLGINGRWLSPRESQVLACLAQGNSNKVIARLQNLSEATVKAHLKAILRKINARNRTQAAIWAIEHGYRNLPLEISGHTVTEAPHPTKLLAFDQTNQGQTNISSGGAPLKKNAATRTIRRETLE
jgi:two-component system, NarL family, nitrate/nitrite response regulator NarL